MKISIRIAAAVAILTFTLSYVHAQSDINRWEGFAGYSYMNLNRGFDPDEFDDNLSDFPTNRVNAHGFNGSITYNFTRWIGAKFDVTLHSHGEDFTASVFPVQPLPGATPPPAVTVKTSQNVYQYMGGIQIKDNERGRMRLKPWAHILGGFAQQKFILDETAPTNVRLFKVDSTDFAMKIGGGIDYGVHKNIDIRFIQVDWNPIFRGDLDLGPPFGTAGSVLQNNWLLTFGVTFH